MKKLALPSQTSRVDLYTSGSNVLVKFIRFISTNTYPVRYSGGVPIESKRKIAQRSILWFIWVLASPLRLVLFIIQNGLKILTIPIWIRIQNHKQALTSLGLDDPAYSYLRKLTEARSWRHRKAAAWELALWHANRQTEEDAKKCLDFLRTVFTFETSALKISRALVLQAEATLRLGVSKKAAADEIIEYIKEYGNNPNLSLALASLTDSQTKRIEYINAALSPSNIAPISISRGKGYEYDRIATRISGDTKGSPTQPLVTVIIPAYNAADTIHTAIESMCSQTWQNLEIIVANDSSTDNTAEIVKTFMKTDSRIKLISTPKNSGPYVARNMALGVAEGEFITCNDSDDWSHPEKIERQVKHLLNNPRVIANASELARAYNDLSFYRRGLPGEYIQVNMSSLMFRKKPVMDKLGYWDSVRFGADSEFIKRLRLSFGDSSVIFMKNSLYSFLRQSDGSLTGSKAFGYHGFLMGARKEYADAQNSYHKKFQELYYQFPMEKRPFSVPYPMLPERRKPKSPREIDIVIAADFRKSPNQQWIKEKVISLKKSGKTVGLVQLYKYGHSGSVDIDSSIRGLVDGTKTQVLVYGEDIKADKLFVVDAAPFEYRQKYIPNIQSKEGVLLSTEESSYDSTLANVKDHFQCSKWSSLKP